MTHKLVMVGITLDCKLHYTSNSTLSHHPGTIIYWLMHWLWRKLDKMTWHTTSFGVFRKTNYPWPGRKCICSWASIRDLSKQYSSLILEKKIIPGPQEPYLLKLHLLFLWLSYLRQKLQIRIQVNLLTNFMYLLEVS